MKKAATPHEVTALQHGDHKAATGTTISKVSQVLRTHVQPVLLTGGYTDVTCRFSEAIADCVGSKPDITADGQIHRFDLPDGRRGNKAGWYVLHLDGIPAGAFGNWRTNESATWRVAHQHQLSRAERQQLATTLQRLREVRRLERERSQLRAQQRANSLWHGADEADRSHPYLRAKQVPPVGIRQDWAGNLLVPLFDVGGTLWNVQRIAPNGAKRFLAGGRVSSCFSLLGTLPDTGDLYLCEGWATAATIHQQAGAPVVAAMNCGNLLPVALALARVLPMAVRLIVAADNDRRTPGNPGMTHAHQAATAMGADLVWPVFPCDGCRCSDFNDLAICTGVAHE